MRVELVGSDSSDIAQTCSSLCVSETHTCSVVVVVVAAAAVYYYDGNWILRELVMKSHDGDDDRFQFG